MIRGISRACGTCGKSSQCAAGTLPYGSGFRRGSIRRSRRTGGLAMGFRKISVSAIPRTWWTGLPAPLRTAGEHGVVFSRQSASGRLPECGFAYWQLRTVPRLLERLGADRGFSAAVGFGPTCGRRVKVLLQTKYIRGAGGSWLLFLVLTGWRICGGAGIGYCVVWVSSSS